MRSVSSSRLGRPVIGSYRAPRCATSTSRALSSAIEASWANRVRASISRSPKVPVGRAGREADDADDLVARGQRHADDGAEHARRRTIAGASHPRVVVVDGDGRPVRKTCAAEPLVDRLAVADALGEEPGAVAEDELETVRLGDVDEAVRRAQQRAGAGQDRLEQHRAVAPVEQRQGRLVEGAQVRVVAELLPSALAWAGLARYIARSATATSASLERPSSGKHATPTLIVTAGPSSLWSARPRPGGAVRRHRGRRSGRRPAGSPRTRRRRSGRSGRRRGSRRSSPARSRPAARRRPGGPASR